MLTPIFIKTLSKFGRLRKRIWALTYQSLARRELRSDWTFMNYGWCGGDSGLELEPQDEINRYCIQLYERVLGDCFLDGDDLLEIGCGRGGGAQWLSRTRKVASVTACDLSTVAIELCRRLHSKSRVKFVVDDAESLSFDDELFDVVINIESSHCFASVPAFASEVARVLRPGGYFCWADMWADSRSKLLFASLDSAGLQHCDAYEITPGVLRALNAEEARKENLFRQVAWWMRPFLNSFSAMNGSFIRRGLQKGSIRYHTRVYRKSE
jgi:ubiquinone/menaquinone biosynthesis C-methylase UbiE